MNILTLFLWNEEHILSYAWLQTSSVIAEQMTRKQSNHTADLNICVIFCLRRQLGGLVGRAPSVTMLVQSRPPPILPLLSLGNPPSSSRRPLRLRSVLQSTCCFVHFTLRGDWAPRRRFSANCVLRVLAINVFILPAASEHAGPALCGPRLSWTCQCIAGLNIVRMSYLRPRVLLRLGCEGVSADCRIDEARLRIATTDLLAMRDEAQHRAD